MDYTTSQTSAPDHPRAETVKRLDPNTFIRGLFSLVWRLAVYFAVLIGGLRLLGLANKAAMHGLGVHFAHTTNALPAEAVGLSQLRLLLAAVLAWAITARLGRDRLGPILPLRPTAIPHLLQGTLWGFFGIGATLAAIACFGGYRVSGFALSGEALAYYLPLWLAIAVLNGLAENLAVLGYPMFRLARAAGWIPAVLAASLAFAAGHLGNPGENPLGIASLFLIAAVLAMAVWLTGDLWLSVGIHAGAVIAEDLVFSVPDSGMVYTGHLITSQLTGPAWLSGGDAGPEGSALAFPVFAILMALLWMVYHRRAHC
jgi:membrane protease YdiL (CAAX protease family)